MINKRRILRTVILALVALGVSALIAWIQIRAHQSSLPAITTIKTIEKTTTSNVAGMEIGGAFTLTDHHGNSFTDKDLQGKYVLAYFGFTYCPAICPTELQKMTIALNQSGAVGEDILPVFITVDPERDTQDIMAAYVAQFHPAMIGLTGTREEIDTVLSAYKIYARKVEDPALSDYTMDHSSYIYFFGKQGELIGIYGMDSKPSDITRSIRETIAAR